MPNEQTVSIDVVKQLIAEMSKQNAENLALTIAAVKAPTALEQVELDRLEKDKAEAMKDREASAADVLQTIENRRINQSICTHTASDGHTHAVLVKESIGPGYFLCQKLQCKIRPEPRPAKNADQGAIYSTPKFNELMQKQRADIIG